jgi:hypothetical protein
MNVRSQAQKRYCSRLKLFCGGKWKRGTTGFCPVNIFPQSLQSRIRLPAASGIYQATPGSAPASFYQHGSDVFTERISALVIANERLRNI